ncbi:alpha-ketoglutarate-dependent dioxygenase AlkB [Paremcibacter congregatus]|uniref:alpha-ketoglutarate-dependent dioxygenase AlkB n=1 Tax=Paremcibacter congregatus TaxID=2043170 RepID=UPI0030EEAD4D|tara:strand:- start:1190 stop:1825 length:636 start_codon:yes stop_codon:yes gene_type:complete
MTDLFSALRPERECLQEGVYLLPNFFDGQEVLHIVQQLLDQAPFRHMKTPGGRRMAVALTNCGTVGWISDTKGYRYSPTDPLTNTPWPPMPAALLSLARSAAEKCGYEDFRPDSCLINRYDPGSALSPHQDRNENDFSQPIVSLSIGRSAMFQLYGQERGGKAVNIRLNDGDILVFGGPARLNFHGVRRLLPDAPAHMSDGRINLTLRQAL